MPAPSVAVSRVRPTCARCGHPVDFFEEVYESHIDKIIFTVRCHGDSERVVLSPSEAVSLRFGEAFQAPRLLLGGGA